VVGVSVRSDDRGDARPIRCLIAKVGLDGHDRGAHVVSRAFRDAGFEVIYSGLHNTPEEIVRAAVQEDVDVLGVSILSGAHDTLVPQIVEGLAEYGAFEDTLVLVGGTIPADDEAALKDAGVAEVFGPGTPVEETIDFVREHARDR
jgi:methylmalonyl-CoA mutase C-terminal domain/subunit